MAESFEECLAALELAVGRLESGEESLEASLEVYEEAIGHLKACHEILSRAEGKVKILTEQGELTDFNAPDPALE